MYVQCYSKECSFNQHYGGKAISITYSVSVCVSVALDIHQAMHTCHIVICGLSGSKYFSTLSHKWHIFLKQLLIIKYVFWFSVQILYETFLILRRTEHDMIKNVYWSSHKVPIILVIFKLKENPFKRLLKHTQISNFMKIHPMGAELFHVDRRMDRHDKTNSHLSQFCKHA
jgi:hypothetical protein